MSCVSEIPAAFVVSGAKSLSIADTTSTPLGYSSCASFEGPSSSSRQSLLARQPEFRYPMPMTLSSNRRKCNSCNAQRIASGRTGSLSLEPHNAMRRRRRIVTVGSILLLLLLPAWFLAPPLHANAASDGMSCVAKNCGKELKTCLSNIECATGLKCFVQCALSSKTEEGVCQTRCMDLYQNRPLEDFTECTLTRQVCYPPLQADSKYPQLNPATRKALWQPDLIIMETQKQKLKELFSGKWYVSAGLNPAFDVFDCQIHEFRPPKDSSKDVVADATFSYRVYTANRRWFTRVGEKRLNLVYNENNVASRGKYSSNIFETGFRWGVESFENSAMRGNEGTGAPFPNLILTLRPSFMDYRDEWVVLGSSPNEFIVLLYRGTNSAWDGYGGMNVYTKTGTIPKHLASEIEASLKKVNLKLSDLTIVDNRCLPSSK